MSNLVLLGGGGHCKSVLDSAIRMNAFDKIVITDPTITPGTKVFGSEVVGNDECLAELFKQGFDKAFITVGSVGINPLREELESKAAEIGFEFPVIIDPTALVSDSVSIGVGTFVGKGVIVNADATIGKHCIINTGSIIEHECIIGDYSHISVGAVLCGRVSVGRRCMIGAGSTIIQGLEICGDCVVGAGSVVNKDLPSGVKVVGVPAKRI